MPPISSWSFQQAVGFSIMLGAGGALCICLALIGLARLWNRPVSRPAPDGSGNLNNAPPPWDRESRPPGRPRTVDGAARAAGIRVTSIKDCARCGRDHPNRLLLPLTNPPADVSHYSICPETDEPILAQVVEVPEKPVGPPNRLVREGEQPPARRR